MEYRTGDLVIMKKKHPCGGDGWIVVRTGADYKLRCRTCGRLVLLSPGEMARAVKGKGDPDGKEPVQ